MTANPNPSAHDLLAVLTSAVIWAEGVAANPTYTGHSVKLAECLTEAREAETAYRGDGKSPITDAIQRSAKAKR